MDNETKDILNSISNSLQSIAAILQNSTSNLPSITNPGLKVKIIK